MTIVEAEKDVFVGCLRCNTCGPEKDTEEEAIKAWNIRVIVNINYDDYEPITHFFSD